MEHHPYITLNDDTEITYSDVKVDESGNDYITIYFETPTSNGFSSMQVDYPKGKAEKVIGYDEKEQRKMMEHYRKIGHLAFEFAKGGD